MRIVFLSDLHMGHKRVSGEHMLISLKTYAYKEIKECDILVITGDFFHSLLDFNHDASQAVVQFMNDLFHMAMEFNIKIRILRGTFSHDRNQLRFVYHAALEYLRKGVLDFKIYEKVSIDEETVNGETIRLLYLPDDIPYKSEEDVFDTARELLRTRKWDDVDIIAAHGYCQHVLPYGKKGPAVTYTIDNLRNICKHIAVFGHIHTPSVKKVDNFVQVYVGSMERMEHGEEERKGFLVLDTSTWKITFIENKNTLKFLTFISRLGQDKSVEDIAQEFISWLLSINMRTDAMNYIRVKHNSVEIRQLLGKILKDQFQDYKCTYSAIAISTEESIINATLEVEDEDTLIVPTEENVVELMKQFADNAGILPVLSTEKIEYYWSLKFEEDY